MINPQSRSTRSARNGRTPSTPEQSKSLSTVRERRAQDQLETSEPDLNSGGDPAPSLSDRNVGNSRYRPAVGIVLLNSKGKVFVGRRIDLEEEAWQMTQGGINEGENARQAAFRELREEIGTDSVEVLAEASGWFYYEVPEELASKAWSGRWKGQRQKWFVMLFKGRDSDIDLATEHPEFCAWRWAPVREVVELAVSFKRQLYLNVIREFPSIFPE
jgi:putative (di)nucleoside polyphosphate hydrolase